MEDDLEAWFPYPTFRPYQREMLELAGSVAREGGIVMIDAPTGSGKSSVVAALLAARAGRKVLVAVRTVSQTRYLRPRARARPDEAALAPLRLPDRQGVHVPAPGYGRRLPAVRGRQGLLGRADEGAGPEGRARAVARPADPAPAQEAGPGTPPALPVLHCQPSLRPGRRVGRSPDGPVGRAPNPRGPARGRHGQPPGPRAALRRLLPVRGDAPGRPDGRCRGPELPPPLRRRDPRAGSTSPSGSSRRRTCCC